MIPCNQGDIVLVSFPFTDLSSSKQRPAIVISSDKYNNCRDDVIIAAITSQIPPRLSFDEFLIPENALTAAGLPKASVIKLGKVITLHRHLVRKSIGRFSQGIISEILSRFLEVFLPAKNIRN